ncbi:MAG: LytTR family DNA-binding domain-containing protein [Clostridiales bacterium]|nr:LytTR family DNA-binding domain-containing protein [Clostridiales bacterium]
MKKSHFYVKLPLIIIIKEGWMRMLRIAICDDEKRCLTDTKCMLESWSAATSSQIQIDCFDNGDSLITESVASRYDIIFLDIVMPLLNGLEAAKELRDRDKTVKIVFLTSSPEFALQSYSVKATDYCLKPVAYEKLKEVMDDCTVINRQEPENLILKTVGGYQKIYLHDIEYIEAQNKRVFFFLKSGKVVEVIQQLYTFETKLSDSTGFFKCHRSYLVYIPNVAHFDNANITMKSGRTIPIARGYGKAFQDAYFTVMFQE